MMPSEARRLALALTFQANATPTPRTGPASLRKATPGGFSRAIPSDTSATPSPAATKPSCAIAEPTSRTATGAKPAARQAAVIASE